MEKKGLGACVMMMMMAMMTSMPILMCGADAVWKSLRHAGYDMMVEVKRGASL